MNTVEVAPQRNSAPPRVFISHASSDKERFVLGFATKLRENGIDAWLDRWEMLPGDSLIDKVFQEGLRGSAAVIVVISSASIESPWVREELNAAFVHRVNKVSKLIPVLIDECEVPECLKSTIWQRIPSLENYDKELKRILMAIFGGSEKPPIGKAPAYEAEKTAEIGSLSKIDSLILAGCCETILRSGDKLLELPELDAIAERYEISKEEMFESIEVLDGGAFVRAKGLIGEHMHFVTVTTLGFETYLTAVRPDYPELSRNVAATLVNENLQNGRKLLEQFNNEPAILIEQIVEVLELRGLVQLSRYNGPPGAFSIISVSGQLRRALRTG